MRLGSRRVTAGAEEAIALAGLLTSFGRAARNTLVKLTGIRVSESTVQRVTEDAGEKLGERLAAKETFGPAKPWPWQRDKTGQRCAYTSLDFVSVPQQGPDGAKAYVLRLSDPPTPVERLQLLAARLECRPIAIMPHWCNSIEE